MFGNTSRPRKSLPFQKWSGGRRTAKNRAWRVHRWMWLPGRTPTVFPIAWRVLMIITISVIEGNRRNRPTWKNQTQRCLCVIALVSLGCVLHVNELRSSNRVHLIVRVCLCAMCNLHEYFFNVCYISLWRRIFWELRLPSRWSQHMIWSSIESREPRPCCDVESSSKKKTAPCQKTPALCYGTTRGRVKVPHREKVRLQVVTVNDSVTRRN